MQKLTHLPDPITIVFCDHCSDVHKAPHHTPPPAIVKIAKEPRRRLKSPKMYKDYLADTKARRVYA